MRKKWQQFKDVELTLCHHHGLKKVLEKIDKLIRS